MKHQKKATNAKIQYEFQIPEGMMVDPPIHEPFPLGKLFESNLAEALSLHTLGGQTTYSSYSYESAEGVAEAWKAKRQRMERVLEREQAVCLIWGELMAAGFKGPSAGRLARLIWMASQCFDHSLAALAKHHHLGDWRFKRLA